jgi:hypothetical protein
VDPDPAFQVDSDPDPRTWGSFIVYRQRSTSSPYTFCCVVDPDLAFQVDPDLDSRPLGSSTVSHQRSVSILSRESVLWIRIRIRVQHFKWIRIWIRATGGRSPSPARGQHLHLTHFVGNQCCGSGSSISSRSGSGSAPTAVVHCLPPEVSQHPHITPSIFALLVPDPDCESESGYGSRGPIDPDPIRILLHNTADSRIRKRTKKIL